MNFNEFDYLTLRNEIDVKCDEIYNHYLDQVEKYEDLKLELYFMASGKLEGIIICLSSLDIPEYSYHNLYKLVSRYQNRLSEVHVKENYYE